MSIMQSDYPLQEGPEVLSADATKAADEAILQQLMAAPPRKPRGRPPGSRNRIKTDEKGDYIPPGRPRITPPTSDEEAAAKRKIEEKKKLAKEYEAKILEANEKLLGFLVQQGVPAGMFYKNGVAPSQGPNSNPNWTDLANQVAIPGHLAQIAGMTAAELQASTIGTSIVSTLEGDSPVRLLVLIGATLIVGVPYVRNLMEIRKRIVALQEAQDMYNREQARAGAPTQGIVG